MKKFLAIFASAVMMMSCLTGCGAAGSSSQEAKPANKLEAIKSSGKLVVGTSPDFVPMEFEDISSGKKEYVGADIELAKYIAKELGVELEIKAMEFMAIQQAVASDVVDLGIAGFAATPKRAEAMNLSDNYNIDRKTDSQHGVLVLKEDAAKYNSPESFSGKKVAAQNASLQQTLVEKNLPKDVELKPIASIPEGVLMLKTGKVDAIALAMDNADNFIEANPELAKAEYVFPYVAEGNVVAMKKGETELLEEINKVIADINESGIFNTWKEEATALAKKLNIKMD